MSKKISKVFLSITKNKYISKRKKTSYKQNLIKYIKSTEKYMQSSAAMAERLTQLTRWPISGIYQGSTTLTVHSITTFI